jgi:hypothetical protein
MRRTLFHFYLNHAAQTILRVGIAAILASTLLPRLLHAQNPAILVGPNIRVSKSSDSPRVEMMIAANPKNPKNLIGTAIVTEQDADRCKVYTSLDGGYTWREIAFADLPETGSGDPQIAFAADGTAYFSALGEMRGDEGKRHFALMLFRSDDGGLTWRKTSVYGVGYAPDHDQLVIDGRANAKNTIYVSVGHFTKLESENIGIFRSDDRGITMIGPLHTAGGAGRGLFSLNPLIFSDGSLFAPFINSEQKPLEQRSSPSTDIYFAISSDGGYTFAPPTKIRTQVLDPNYNVGNKYAAVVFALDSSEKFGDRVYMAWGEALGGHYHLNFSSSDDKGKTWSAPHEVGAPKAETNQFRPAMAVSSQGVLGISWFDTRDTDGNRQYNEFFTASTDGGESFFPPVRISSQSSGLDTTGNVVLRPTIDSPRTNSGAIGFSFASTNSGFPDGGDYMGLAADADGNFHPFWADTRSGSFQAWTAAIKIDLPERRAKGIVMANSSPVTITEKFWPLFDPARYDAESGVEEIPVRLKNISESTVCKPLVAEIKNAEAGREINVKTQILNARNENASPFFDYSNALGSFSCLAPGEATDAVVWRVKPAKDAKSFVSFNVSVTGVVASKEK